MKLRIYTSDWFYNLGVVGFHRIIRFAEENLGLVKEEYEYKINENYIEFDQELLKDFHEYYFEYMFDSYNNYENVKEKIEKYLRNAKVEKNYSNNLGYIKDQIKKNNKKIKDIDTAVFEKSNSINLKISKIKQYEDYNKLVELCEYFLDILKTKKINKKITSNKFEKILHDNFFGQNSFLNISNSNKTIDEKEGILYKDYIKPIFETSYIDNILEDKSTVNQEEIKLKKEENKGNEFQKIYKWIIDKKNKITDFNSYINDNYSSCTICGGHRSYGSSFTEGNFLPLGISNENRRNMFWNFNYNYPICDLCKLILFCTPVGATDIYKTYMETGTLEDKHFYGFINMDIDIEDLIKYNDNFMLSKNKDAPIKELIINIVEELKEKSVWQLQNILYVEFNAIYRGGCKLNYLNIPKYLALFFKHKYDLLDSIKDEKFKMKLLDELLQKRDIKYSINDKLRELIKDERNYSYNCYLAVQIRNVLNQYRGGNGMDEKKDQSKKLFVIYQKGAEINKYLKDKGGENKINGIAYRLLNATKAGNKNEFMDSAIRTFMSAEKEVPSLFLDVINEKNMSFEEISYAFISGLISGEYVKEVKKDE
jgi:CRISPR-associated protein Cst1